jgi:16S rRNA (guanine527-N7)-methyltransferase
MGVPRTIRLPMSPPDRAPPDPGREGRRRRLAPGQPSPTATGAAVTADASDSVLRETLAQGANRLGVPLGPEQLDRLLKYRALLEKWSRVHNITAVRDGPAIVARHLLDSLAIVPALRLQAESCTGRPLRVLDAGSGAGLPGLVVAIAMNEVEVCCVDSVAKKAAFVRHAAAELAVPNIRVEHARVEALDVGPFDVVVSRAFASLADFVRLTRRHLRRGGVWLAMKGQRSDEESAALPADVEMFHVEPINVPGVVAPRCLIWMRVVR